MSTANKLLQAASGGGDDLTYVEDVFSTNLYTGNSSSQVITTGINASDNEALFWAKCRDAALSHRLADTVRGINKVLVSNSDAGEATSGDFTSASSTGITVNYNSGNINQGSDDDVLWAFRKQAGFFDIVTYTGDGTNNRTINHNLGCKPGMIWVKSRSQSEDWQVWHRNSGLTYGVASLNKTGAWTNTGGDNAAFGDAYGNATTFTTGNGSRMEKTNKNNVDYVAYLFAGQGDSDSQIFGDDSDEAIIKCGSYTGNAGDKAVTVGFEPQWVLIKNTANADNWWVVDMMRGVFQGSNDSLLVPNSTSTEDANADYINFDASGFTVHTSYGIANENGSNYIYMAIRRPMKAPEYGTDVFAASAGGSSGALTLDTNFRVDFNWLKGYTTTSSWYVSDRLRGSKYVAFDSTAAESSLGINWDRMTGWQHTGTGDYTAWFGWSFKRAPKFLDIITYIGNATNGRTITHNLGVAPEIIITKRRSSSDGWPTGVNFTASNYDYLSIQSDGQANNNAYAFRYMTKPTASSYTIDQDSSINGNNETYIVYMFATLAGVSKVGTYSGTGSDVNVDCGFSSGARFVLIKRTDSTGGPWIVFDSVRGIVAGNDPYILLNSTAAQVTGNDLIDPLSSGFTVTAGAGASLNANGGTYIFVAIA
jgi:hypothetical protein